MLAVGALSLQGSESRLLAVSVGCLVLGTIIFSGSLYILVLTNVSAWGAITPFGGSLLIVGWGLLAVALWKAFSPQ